MRTDGELKLSAGTLYRSIQRMLEQGLHRRDARPPGAGRRRRAAAVLPDHAARHRDGEGRGAAAGAAGADGAGQGLRAGKGLSRLMRAYNLLLRLYPASFRNEYGDEMRAVFARRLRERPGRSSAIALWLGTIAEVARQRLSRPPRPARAGLALHAADAAARAGIRDHRGADRGARHRRDDRRVLGHRLRPDPAAAVSAAPIGWSRCGSGRPATAAWSCRRRTIRDWKAASTVFERIGMYHLDQREHARRRRAAARRRRGGLGRSVPDARRAAADRPDLHRRGRSRRRRRHGDPELPPLADALRRRSGRRRPAAVARRRRRTRSSASCRASSAFRRATRSCGRPLRFTEESLRRSQRQLDVRGRPAARRRDARAGARGDGAHRRALQRRQYPKENGKASARRSSASATRCRSSRGCC